MSSGKCILNIPQDVERREVASIERTPAAKKIYGNETKRKAR
jgi:hypothetical protein